MTTKQMTLWQVIEALARQVPFTKAKLEALLSTTLSETDDTGNDVFQFFKSNRVALQSGVEIANVDLRVKRVGPHPGFMVLEIGGTCITLDQVRRHYSALKITDTPRGRSLEDATSYTAYLPWGELSFSFRELNPECLASIAFNPKKSP